MADVDVTADDQRAADVPKVKRESHEDSVAADAAKRVDPKPPRGAQAHAEEIAEDRESAEDSENKVSVKVSDSAPEFEGDVVVNHSSGNFTVPRSGTVEVDASVVDALGDHPFVEVVD